MSCVQWSWRATMFAVAAMGLAACSSSTDSGGNTGGSSANVAGSSANAGGGSGNSALTTAEFGAKYKLQDGDVAGWNQVPGDSALRVYTDKNLTDEINGASPKYVSRGCTMAMYQDTKGPEPQLAKITVMEFGTEANAKTMFDAQVQSESASIAIPEYDQSVALGSGNLTGITAFAHIKSLYFEIAMDGYGDDSAAAAQGASKLLKALEAKIK